MKHFTLDNSFKESKLAELRFYGEKTKFPYLSGLLIKDSPEGIKLPFYVIEHVLFCDCSDEERIMPDPLA